MIDLLLGDPIIFLLWIGALLSAITVHEFAHAYAADRLGDPTPRLQGRLTLNPLAHLDPVGTLMLILFRFGWGRPVQFDPYNLKDPKRDAAIISVAGPASNFLLASVLSIILRLSSLGTGAFITPFIILNVVLGVFNLIPIHPLDGGKILVGLLPREDAHRVDIFLKRWGMVLLIILILPIGGSSPVFTLLSPVIDFLLRVLIPGGGFF